MKEVFMTSMIIEAKDLGIKYRNVNQDTDEIFVVANHFDMYMDYTTLNWSNLLGKIDS